MPSAAGVVPAVADDEPGLSNCLNRSMSASCAGLGAGLVRRLNRTTLTSRCFRFAGQMLGRPVRD